jgi:tetratricopeptide (TPR) repeat protein
MGRRAEALLSFKRAREIQETLVREYAHAPQHLETLSWTISNIGVIHQELGRLTEALRLHRQAIRIHEDLVDREPGNTRYRSDLAWCWHYLGAALAASGDGDAALQLAQRALASLEELAGDDSGQVEDRWRLARCHDDVGAILLRLGRPDEAAVPLERAARSHEARARDNIALYCIDLVRNNLYIASQQAATGHPDEALARIRRAEELLDQFPSVLPGTLYDLACAYSLWSASGRGGPSPPAERGARAEKAMAVLRKVVAAGHADLGRILRDPLLDPLRARRDFGELILELSFPAGLTLP